MAFYRSSLQGIECAAEILRIGGLVAFPTETVYGLGADATNQRAVARIFTTKGRSPNHPLTVHLSREDELDRWARDIPAEAWRLAAHFWPGPITLILKRAPDVLDIVTGGQDTIGLRMPDHPLALMLLKAFGGGIAAPSANRFGRVSPTTAGHVFAELGDAVDCILDGGPCSVGLESTILDLSGTRPQVLRAGAITPDALAERLGVMPATGEPIGLRVPGYLPAHYAPVTPLRLLEAGQIEPAAWSLLLPGQMIVVLSMQPSVIKLRGCRWWTMPADPKEYARVLYACLREADTADCHYILVERPPVTMEWEAVRDRLARAAAGANHNKRGSL